MLTKPNFLAKKMVMIHANQGDRISFSNDNLVVRGKDKKIKMQYTCHKIFIVYIVGGFSITTGLIERGRRFGISFVFLTGGYKFYESIPYQSRGNTLLVRRQYNLENDFQIAQKIVYNKLKNQRSALSSIRAPKERLDLFDKGLDKLASPIVDLSTLMGIEGTAAKIYFNTMFEPLDWHRRQPRVKNDIPNLLLDIGYTILFNYVEALVSIYGFDTYKGNLHQEFYNRKSLICDLIEPFRVIVDKKVRKLFTLKQISDDDFLCIKGRYVVNFKSNRHYAFDLAREINSYSDCIFSYIQSYYRWFMKEQDVTSMPIGGVYKNDFD